MKKKEFIKIKGIDFELMGRVAKTDCYFPSRHGASVNEIYDRYKNPSWIKFGVWASWVNWFNMNSQGPNDYLVINSATCQFFSIKGFITVVNGKERKKYELFISHAYNMAWEVA